MFQIQLDMGEPDLIRYGSPSNNLFFYVSDLIRYGAPLLGHPV